MYHKSHIFFCVIKLVKARSPNEGDL